jgi:hypothetical protein
MKDTITVQRIKANGEIATKRFGLNAWQMAKKQKNNPWMEMNDIAPGAAVQVEDLRNATAIMPPQPQPTAATVEKVTPEPLEITPDISMDDLPEIEPVTPTAKKTPIKRRK